jgi:hypothetical protein
VFTVEKEVVCSLFKLLALMSVLEEGMTFAPVSARTMGLGVIDRQNEVRCAKLSCETTQKRKSTLS